MTGKIIDSGAPVALALILPIALILVVLYTAWPFILLVIALIIGWKIWENYQWQKLSQKVNPFFNQLLRENQGCLTHTDLSLKADLSAAVAQQYLEKKAEEYGAKCQQIKNKGSVYYFLTASALGSMFDDSEPLTNSEIEESRRSQPKSKSYVGEISQLVDLEPGQIANQESSQQEYTSENSESINNRSLIQAELAKRLALNSSTVGRRKSDPDFSEWSKSKDPESIAWKYVSKTKVFVPVDM